MVDIAVSDWGSPVELCIHLLSLVGDQEKAIVQAALSSSQQPTTSVIEEEESECSEINPGNPKHNKSAEVPITRDLRPIARALRDTTRVMNPTMIFLGIPQRTRRALTPGITGIPLESVSGLSQSLRKPGSSKSPHCCRRTVAAKISVRSASHASGP